MPANKDHQAEIIEILNSDSNTVRVPMREEDVELQAFHERSLSKNELEAFKNSQTWKLFNTWDELMQDHIKLKLSENVLRQVLRFKNEYELQGELDQ
ncbi:hypothetical protein D1627_13870 [Pontibacter oryzae]|uniref:Uncharacterized protein n=1 Tax=Pontibacter oryzae TaxID=2304593 RepID=A0A399S4X9_9BACT|nr:hypothetical protein D1627_13870 [Pontibacter oryzae]